MNAAQFKETIARWVERPWPTLSDSERAILENNLKAAMGYVQSDLSDLAELHAIVAWCYNELPTVCWGSKEKVDNWIKVGGPEGWEAQRAAAG